MACIVATPCMAKPSSSLIDYPVRNIRIIVAASPSTAEDYFARALAEQLEKIYKRGIIVDNRAGAGGLIGNTVVSKARGDGYTLGMIGVSRLITELLHDNTPYRALADIVGVAHVASVTNVLIVNNSLLPRNAKEFVSYARSNPGVLNYASLGIGSASHLAGELFTHAIGATAVHVPFTNASETYVEMGLGRVHYAIYTLPAVMPMVNDRRVRAFAVMTPQRSPALPNVPSVAELGLPEAQIDSWSGIVAPAGTPRRIVEQLNGAIVESLRSKTLRDSFVRQGADSTPESTPDGFMRLMQEEYLRYQGLIREGAITQK